MSGTAGITAGRAYVRLGLDSSEFVKGLRGAETKLRNFGSRLSSLGASLTGMATAAALPIALSTRVFAGFQDQMLAVQAVSQSTREEFERLYAQAKQLGATTSFTAGQVAGGQLSLARMGFRPQEIEASIPGVLNLARATGTELAQAADIAAGTLRAFNLEAGQMDRVSDVLVATANNSAQTLEDLGESMKYVAPVAYQYGLSLEQTAKALGVLANLQIKGTMAGTSLRQMMLQLANPDVQKRLAGLGITAVDAAGNMRPLGDVMVEIGKAMAKMGSGERLALGKDLFNQRAVSAGLTLATQQFDSLSDAIDNAAGVSDRTAKIMDSGLGGMFRILMSAVEGVQIAIGEALTETLTRWGTDVTEIANKTRAWIQQNKGLVIAFTAAVAAIGAAGTALIAFGAAAKGAAAVVGLVSMVASMNPVVLALAAAVGAASVAFALWGDEIAAALNPAFAELAKVAREDLLPVLVDLGAAFKSLLADAGPILDMFVGEAVVGGIKNMAFEMKVLAAATKFAADELERVLKLKGFKGPGTQLKDVYKEGPAVAAGAAAKPTAKPLPDLSEFFAPYQGTAGATVDNVAAKTKEAIKQNERMLEEISKERIKRIGDETSEAIAAINRRYDAERKKAEKLGASLSLVEEARKTAIAAVDEDKRRRQAEEESRKEKEKRHAAQSIQDQIARQEIENRWAAQLPGDQLNARFRDEQKEKALLELERKQALRDAKLTGQNPDQINRLFDMRFASLDMDFRSRAFERTPNSVGTFSAVEAFRMGIGRKGGPEEETAAATKKIAKSADKQVDKLQTLISLAQQGGRMGP